MSIQWDASGDLPRLRPKPPPAIAAVEILAVDTVTLFAGAMPVKAIRAWYEGTFGLTFVSVDIDELRFRLEQRAVAVRRIPRPDLPLEPPSPEDLPQPGKLFLAVSSFATALALLTEHGVSYELLHTESGLARMAIVADPAGNWIYLVERRPV
jgi:hypothetical protein